MFLQLMDLGWISGFWLIWHKIPLLFFPLGITTWREKLTFQYPFECNCGEEHPAIDMFMLEGALFPLRFFSETVNLLPAVFICSLPYYFYSFKAQFVLSMMFWAVSFFYTFWSPLPAVCFLTHYPSYSLL